MEGDLPDSALSPQAREGLEKIRELNRDRDAMLLATGTDESSLRDPETYIRHYWDFDSPDGGEAARRAIATRMMRDPSLQTRTIGTLKAGITPIEEGGYGLTPKYDNVADVLLRNKPMFATPPQAVEVVRISEWVRKGTKFTQPIIRQSARK